MLEHCLGNYELLLYLKYILESNKESNKEQKDIFLYNEYEKTRSLVANSKDGGLSKQDIKYLKNNLANLEKSFIDSFKIQKSSK